MALRLERYEDKFYIAMLFTCSFARYCTDGEAGGLSTYLPYYVSSHHQRQVKSIINIHCMKIIPKTKPSLYIKV